MSVRIPLAVAASLLALPGVMPPLAQAATSQWQTVAEQAGSTVEIDKSRIVRLKGGKIAAWTQLTLDHAVLDFENRLRYSAVRALNHYDCAKGSFATQNRLYLLEGREMKAEQVNGPPMPAKPDSLDARLLDEVCTPRTAAEMQQAAARRADTARAADKETKPRAMHAEYVANGDMAAPRSVKVADARTAASAPAPAAPALPAGDKPRLFDMPVIDKSKAEDPYKSSPPPSQPPSPGSSSPSSPPSSAAPAPAARPAGAASPAPTGKGAAPAIPSQTQELTRQQRELMLATTGPRKQLPKKAEPVPVPVAAAGPIHWSYRGAGAPENWGRLDGNYALCGTGRRQSPIDIRDGIRVDLEAIRFDYRPTQFRIADTGHTVQVDVADGNIMTVMGRTYTLAHIHFHRPSEERINGRAYDMVAHLVHQDYEGHLAVIAVLMDRGTEHPLIQTLWNHMPLEAGLSVTPPNVAIDLMKLLPEKRDYYTYMGSLTTPPCTENVLWMVFKEPIAVSPEQIAIFARLYPYNARPIQPTHDRLIKESR